MRQLEQFIRGASDQLFQRKGIMQPQEQLFLQSLSAIPVSLISSVYEIRAQPEGLVLSLCAHVK